MSLMKTSSVFQVCSSDKGEGITTCEVMTGVRRTRRRMMTRIYSIGIYSLSSVLRLRNAVMLMMMRILMMGVVMMMGVVIMMGVVMMMDILTE